jgi:alkylated DNA repair dioxygenase AlkB
MPVPKIRAIVSWCKDGIDRRLNGLLLNWYDGTLGHYIGKHRDSTKNMVKGAPIVTLSFGKRRTFRLRPWRTSGEHVDFDAENGTMFVMPYETNLAWTHEVPTSTRSRGRRISFTLRAFE